MTEPDKARIAWNACAAARYDDEENGNPLGLPQGMPNFEDFRDGYRAGAAASAERIKELEARVAELEDMASRYLIQMSDMLTRLEERYPEDFVWLKDGDEPTDEARALLKETTR